MFRPAVRGSIMNRRRGFWVLLFMLLFGAVAGSAVAQALGQVLPLLTRGIIIGIPAPMAFDLDVLSFSLAMTITINLGGALGILAALFLYRR